MTKIRTKTLRLSESNLELLDLSRQNYKEGFEAAAEVDFKTIDPDTGMLELWDIVVKRTKVLRKATQKEIDSVTVK